MEEFGLGVEETQPVEKPAEAQQPAVQEPAQPELGGEGKPKEVSQPDVVPEKYSFEGESEKYNETVGAVAGELGMSQEKVSRIAEAIDKADTEDLYEQAKEWSEEIKKDPEIGGANREAAIAAAKKVLDKYMPNKQTQMLFAEGALGCHPDFVRMLYRISKDLPQEPKKRSLFPNSKMGD